MGSSGEQRQLGLGIGPYSFLPFSLTSEPVKPFLENGKEQIRACNFLVSARWVFWDRRHVTVLWTGLDWGFWFWCDSLFILPGPCCAVGGGHLWDV